jgi:hypothetical protein
VESKAAVLIASEQIWTTSKPNHEPPKEAEQDLTIISSCCEGVWSQRGQCRPSSLFLATLCEQAYANPYDDDGHVDRCEDAKFIK